MSPAIWNVKVKIIGFQLKFASFWHFPNFKKVPPRDILSLLHIYWLTVDAIPNFITFPRLTGKMQNWNKTKCILTFAYSIPLCGLFIVQEMNIPHVGGAMDTVMSEERWTLSLWSDIVRRQPASRRPWSARTWDWEQHQVDEGEGMRPCELSAIQGGSRCHSNLRPMGLAFAAASSWDESSIDIYRLLRVKQGF